MFSNFKRISTSEVNNYARLLNDNSAERKEEINFPCGVELIKGFSLRGVLSFTHNTNEIPSTMLCGDMLWGGDSAICLNCFAEYDHQENGDVVSIPLRGLSENEEADVTHSESKLVRFAKNHPYLAAGIGVLFAAGAIGAALGAYRAYSESSASSSALLKPTSEPLTAEPTTIQPTTTIQSTATIQPTTTIQSTTVIQSTTAIQSTATTQSTTTIKSTTIKPTTIKPTTLKPTTIKPTTIKPTTTQSTTAAQPTTQSIALTPAKRSGVNRILVKLVNLRARRLSAEFEVCDPNCAVVKRESVFANREKYINLDIKDNFVTAKARYSFDFESMPPLKSSSSNQVFPEGRIEFARNETIDSLDKNENEELEVKHTLLNFEKANRLDQVFEDEDGMPKYASITTSPMKLILDNRWKGAAYFAVNAKGAETTFPYKNVRVWTSRQINLPAGIHEIDMNLESYAQKNITGQALNKVLAGSEGSVKTLCITSNYNKPTYLSNIKSGRCGR